MYTGYAGDDVLHVHDGHFSRERREGTVIHTLFGSPELSGGIILVQYTARIELVWTCTQVLLASLIARLVRLFVTRFCFLYREWIVR